jgi:hypothetical protein
MLSVHVLVSGPIPALSPDVCRSRSLGHGSWADPRTEERPPAAPEAPADKKTSFFEKIDYLKPEKILSVIRIWHNLARIQITVQYLLNKKNP